MMTMNLPRFLLALATRMHNNLPSNQLSRRIPSLVTFHASNFNAKSENGVSLVYVQLISFRLLLAFIRIQVALCLRLFVLSNQVRNYRSCFVKLPQSIVKGSFLLVAFEVCIPFPHLVILDHDTFKQRRNRSMVRKHEA